MQIDVRTRLNRLDEGRPRMPTFSQQGSMLSLVTPFGADVLLLERLSGREAISALFEFTLEMRSSHPNLDPAEIVGRPVTVTIASSAASQRHITGIVKRFRHVGGSDDSSLYRVDLVPKLWLLTLGSDRVIYQKKSAADIVRTVLDANGIEYEDRLVGEYAVRDYCVCYDESPFMFLSRLMEDEGIFYFFRFDGDQHTMVLADAASVHQPCKGAPALRYVATTSRPFASDAIHRFEWDRRLVTQRFTLNDYDFEQSTNPLLSSASGTTGRGEHYLFPGKHTALDQGEKRARLRVDAAQLDAETGHGASHCHALGAGVSFSLSGYHRDDVNAVHVLSAVCHQASERNYENTFDTFLESRPFRSRQCTPRPFVAGLHTAVVVGPSDEEIWTDALGRVKVQLHWDRRGKHDDNSSCWVRVAQTMAGRGWGQWFLPRVGQEVLICYVDGDPDRPVIIGSVYNDALSPPVQLPSEQTQSVIRSRSSKGGQAGNEIRMEDKRDHEQLVLHAQKDLQIDVEQNLLTTLLTGSEMHTVKHGDRTVEVQAGKETHLIKGDRALHIGGDETHDNHGRYTHQVAGDFTLKVSGSLSIDVTGDVMIKAGTALHSQAGTSLSNKAGLDLTNEAGTALENKAGTTLTNQGLTVESKASATQTVDGGGMLTLKGAMVGIN